MIKETGSLYEELEVIKSDLLEDNIKIEDLSSIKIKKLLEMLDWSKENEKKIIIDLCRTITTRGDASLVTGEQKK